ncbi:MAG: hypothetical protein ACXIUM_03330 [Wenzhouxiangella sp.]
MTHRSRLTRLALGILLLAALAGCDLRPERTDETAHVLRVHDVSQLQVDELESTLNLLLGSDSLPLRGHARMIDQSHLAVNGSEHLQDQIARVLADLQLIETRDDSVVDRDFRLQFWLLTLAPEGNDVPLPPTIEELADVIRDQFPQYAIRVSDFIETFASNSMPNLNILSGPGTNIFLSPVRLQSDGVHVTGRVQARAPRGAHGGLATFNISRKLLAGQPLVLGRAHGGSLDERALYQVLVARMDWND